MKKLIVLSGTTKEYMKYGIEHAKLIFNDINTPYNNGDIECNNTNKMSDFILS
jgi:hypothetical protein